MADYPALPLWTDAYIGDTQHLTNEEHGVYLRLLMFAWRSPTCSLPANDDRLAQIVSVTPKVWKRLKPTIMAFWTLRDGQWTQKRLTAGRDYVRALSNRGRSGAEARWKAKSLENNNQDDAKVYANDIPNGYESDTSITITKKKEEEDARARGADSDFEEIKEPQATGLSPGFLPDLMQALGVDTGDVPRYWRADTAAAHVQGWIKAHGLTEEQILASARESRKRTPEPPDGPKALDAWMAKCATGYSAVGEIKATPGKPKDAKPPATPEERLRFWAERINSPAYIAPTAINNTMAAALLKSGLVTKEALRSKGIAA